MRLLEFKTIICFIITAAFTLPSKSYTADNLSSETAKSSFAHPKCEGIDNPVFLIEDGVLCATLLRFSKIHTEVQTASPVAIPINKILFYKNYELEGIAYNNFLTLAEGGDRALWPERQNLVWIHELGHAIFNNLLAADFAEHQAVVDMDAKRV